MSDIKSWANSAASNNAAPPNGWPEGMAFSAVNDTARETHAAVRRWYENAQWTDLGHVPTETSATTFTIPTDVTAIYTVGRRLKLTDSSTLYGTINTSSFAAGVTTVTVTLDSGSLSGSLSAVAVGILTPNNSSIPTVPVANGGTGATSGAAALANLGAMPNPLTTEGDILVMNATPAPARLALGARGTFLQSNGTDAVWAAFVPRGHLGGFVTSNNGGSPTTKVDIAAGQCADDTGAVVISNGGTLTVNFGTTGANGLDTGSLTASKTYHVYVIAKADGTVAGFANRHDLTAFSPTLPSGYVYKRRVASVLTDSSANIIAYLQNGDEFEWKSPTLDVNGTAIGTSQSLQALSVPLGLSLLATVNVVAASSALYLRDPATTDQAVSATASPLANAGNSIGAQVQVRTNTSAQIEVRSLGAGNTTYIATCKWIDRRGRDD